MGDLHMNKRTKLNGDVHKNEQRNQFIQGDVHTNEQINLKNKLCHKIWVTKMWPLW